jgi:large subunit ribosomal protein L24
MSNVLLHCNRCNRGTRTGSRLQKDGGKERFCKKCGTSLGQIAAAKKK